MGIRYREPGFIDWLPWEFPLHTGALSLCDGHFNYILVAWEFHYIPECQQSPPCGAPCGEDWIWYRGKCYYFSETYDEWDNSQSYCTFHNASLAIVHTQEEMDFLGKFKGPQDHWIGLHRETEKGLWVWVDGSSFNNMFRITGTFLCVYINDVHAGSSECHEKKRWICNRMDI
ncbi:hypothetical protein GDO86_013660 [Hymenochirus boettgeri]|uniref:C-type lectin domain-containing protein n=1 Tax=Hymenochirus boettgeri TaxID=247094 RepID=A0A8T2IS82_9PIPI|nr:hypothetical protein GDO86_013660 [Hymenochirus boettgeri]